MKKEFRKIFFISIFFAGFFIVLTITLIIPLIKGIEKDSKDLIAVRADREFFSEEKNNIKKFENIFKEIEPNFKKIDEYFVNSEVPIEFIDFLEKLASNFNVLIKISPSVSLEKSKTSSWLFLNFNLEASGSFVNFSKFIEKLENSPYLIQVQDLDIKKAKQGIFSQENSTDEIDASFILKVFAK